MAGIGFELRKAIQQDSIKGKFSGYMGAAFSSSGSMIIGIVLFFFIQLAAKIENVPQNVIDQFMCYVTNTMFFFNDHRVMLLADSFPLCFQQNL